MVNRLKRTATIIFVIVSAVTSLADATIETFEFTGTINNVHGHSHALTGVDKETEFKGTYWFDTEKLKEIQSSLTRKNSYVYNLFVGDNEAFGLTMTIGDMTFTSGSERNARIISYSRNKQERFYVTAYADGDNSRSMEYVTLSLTGKNNALGLKSDPLLLDGADMDDKKVTATMTYLNSHAENRFQETFGNRGRSFTYTYATGDLTSFAHIGGGGSTPEPATLAILIFGGGVIVFRRTRKTRAPSK